jgi:hypothetical protein
MNTLISRDYSLYSSIRWGVTSMKWVAAALCGCIAGFAVSAQAGGKLDWMEVGRACAAAYGLHDGSGRNSREELDCIDYYNAHGRMPPTQKAAERYTDAHTDWIQTLCVGAAGRASLGAPFRNYDSCIAWAAYIGLSQKEAKRLAGIYGIHRN